MKSRWKQGRKTKTQQNSHHPFPLCEIFAQHIPLCEFSFVTNFKKHALGPFPKSQCEFHRNANLVRIRFCANFQNHALCLGEPQECEIFALPITLCEIHISSLKAIFSSSILSFFFFNSLNTSFPITYFHPKAPLLHHPPSLTPPWQPISIAPLHSRDLHYSPQSTPSIFSSFSSFHHQKPFNSSLNTLNPSLNQSQPCFYQTKTSS